MKSISADYSQLIKNLEQFIKKYHLNQIIRGTLFASALIVAFFLLINFIENQWFLSQAGRKIMWYSFLATSLGSIVYWIALPVSRYFKIGDSLSHEQAASIIGSHFSSVEDRLLNILQLQKEASHQPENELLLASIQQKSFEIKPVSFPKAIDLGKNRKYLKFSLPPALVLLGLLLMSPGLIKEPTTRLIQNSKDFEREAPFRFVLQNTELKIEQYQDFDIQLQIEGDVLPSEVFVHLDGVSYRMKDQGKGAFTHRVSNVQKNKAFYFTASWVQSADYQLVVIEKPVLSSFEVELDYPAYTGRKDELIKNTGDLIVPVGTRLRWIFDVVNTDQLDLLFVKNAEWLKPERHGEQSYILEKRVTETDQYRVYLKNKHSARPDSMQYSLNIIPDQYPNIQLERFVDSTQTDWIYFAGAAGDDYGVSKLQFRYRVKSSTGEEGPLHSKMISYQGKESISFEYAWNIDELGLRPGDEIVYYFEVFDNDGIAGPKSSRSNVMSTYLPSLEELEEKMEENDEAVKKELDDKLKEARRLQDDIKRARERLLEQKQLEWQNKEDLERFMDKQEEMRKDLEKAKEQLQENIENLEKQEKSSEDIREKQEKLEEMFEELVDEESQELMDKIQELMEQLDRDQALDLMEQMEMSQHQMEQNMDRLLELYKQLELELEVQQQIDKLNELAEKQEELAEETEEQKKENDELKKEQEDIKNEFEKVQEKQEGIEKKNQELDKPKSMEDQKENMDDIEKDMDSAQDQLQQGKNGGASKKQKSAAQKMRQMAQSMEQEMEEDEQEQLAEDLKALRQLLENLVGLSFDQEDLVALLSKARINTPHYISLVQDQHKLKRDFALIEDSLRALAKRQFQIETFVLEKLTEINDEMDGSMERLEERQKSQASDHQRRTMTSVNDLALMLSEAMNRMQQQMAAMMKGNQMCNNPGGGKQGKSGAAGNVPMDKITEGQKNLNSEMEKMAKARQQGKSPGSKEFAQAAARQAALRKALENLQKENSQQGKASGLLQELIDQMDKTEVDLVNKRLTNEMLKRQQEIMTRLLEAERADKQREWDNKRKSESAVQQDRTLPPSLESYLRERKAALDVFKPVSPQLNPYYKFLVEAYYRQLKSQ